MDGFPCIGPAGTAPHPRRVAGSVDRFAGASDANGVAVGLVLLEPLATGGRPAEAPVGADHHRQSVVHAGGGAAVGGGPRYGWKAASDTVALS